MHAHDIAKPATDILAHILEDDEVIPNSRLPLLIYRAALSLPDREQAAAVEELLAGNGWSGSWRSFGVRNGSGCWNRICQCLRVFDDEKSQVYVPRQ